MNKFLTACLCVVFAGCATEDHKNIVAERLRGPQIGMSRVEVDRVFGGPNRKWKTDSGEVWSYDNIDQVKVPFNWGWRYKSSFFSFDLDGKLSHWAIGQDYPGLLEPPKR